MDHQPTALHLLRRHLWLARGAILCALALALRLYRLGAQSLWLDEGSTWAEVTGRTGKGWLPLLGELFSPNASYPLYHIILKAWISLVGDSEWMLRLPSALAGAAAVLVLFIAAHEHREHDHPAPHHQPLIAGIILATSPFAIWHAQDAKVYSILILTITLELWALLRAIRTNRPQNWLLLASIAIISIFVHRLAILVAAGAALAAALVLSATPLHRRRFLTLLATALGLALIGSIGMIHAIPNESQGESGHRSAGALQGLWLTLTHFSLDRSDIGGLFGIPLALWALPALILTLWGTLLLIRDALHQDRHAIATLCFFGIPLALFALILAVTHTYEPRYATILFPTWILLITRPFKTPHHHPTPPHTTRRITRTSHALLTTTLFIDALVLLQPQHGIFSGAPIKEQWRDAITYLAQRVHPDDLVILHPYYVAPLYAYYAPRVTPDPLPEPTIFWIFAEGYRRDFAEYVRKRYEPDFQRAAQGKKRMFLLIAPDHARTVDPPINPPQDTYGWVGLRFQYPQHTWPCGGSGAALIGVAIMCQSFPEYATFGSGGTIPQPTIARNATFANQLRLRGYSLDLAGGKARPGGTLPITLYWEAITQPTNDYSIFLHLCRDCTSPPLANDDGPPLGGYGDAGHTTTWQIHDPVHDERTLKLPATLAPGTYTLILGVYPIGNPSPTARLAINAPQTLDTNRLILGEITITAP